MFDSVNIFFLFYSLQNTLKKCVSGTSSGFTEILNPKPEIQLQLNPFISVVKSTLSKAFLWMSVKVTWTKSKGLRVKGNIFPSVTLVYALFTF